jgi:hypothetical protein
MEEKELLTPIYANVVLDALSVLVARHTLFLAAMTAVRLGYVARTSKIEQSEL